MKLGGSEFILSFILAIIGLLGNLKLILNQTEKNKRIKWSASIYGAALLVFICGLLTPPDLFSNMLFSVPLTVVYLVILRKIVFERLGLNRADS